MAVSSFSVPAGPGNRPGCGNVKLSLYFWRSRSGNEVDFVLYGNAGFCGIEVKNSSSIQPRDLSGLRAFGEDYSEARRLFLYRGKETINRRGIRCMPVEEFLREVEEFLRELVPRKPMPGMNAP